MINHDNCVKRLPVKIDIKYEYIVFFFFLLFSSGFILAINSAFVEYTSMRSKTVQLTDRDTDILKWPTRIIHNGRKQMIL